ncbi:MAG: alpha/beta hydrolase [Anaerolineae bacterium]|nr:alpha/beta hydrolase [Anaerolineae bacterium]
MKYGRYFILFALLVCIGGLTTAQGDYTPDFEEVDCFFSELDADMSCGYLYVPEDRSNLDEGEVELAVIILYAHTDNPAPDPVIYLEGGPGGAALLAVEDLINHPVLDTHDVIVFDQRGTGFSYPSLNCPEIEEDDSPDSITACRDRLLDEGVNLDMYNTVASAADVNDLRIALGYEEVDLWGISYGTKLALTTMRDYPEGIRSVVIDSVYPPETDDLSQTSVSFVGAYEALFARCAADADCDATFPDLEFSFYDLIDRLNQSPEIIATEDGDVELTGDELAAQLFLALYDTLRIPYLPYALTLIAEAGDEDTLLEGYLILTGEESLEDNELPESVIMESDWLLDYTDEFGDIEDSEGMAYSFDCSEEYQLDDLDAAYAVAEAAPEPLQEYFIGNIEGNVQACEIWGVETADELEAQRVESDIPTLIYSGVFDPITPASSGASAADGLPNSLHVIFPTAGHGISFTDNAAGTCAKQIMQDFLGDPWAELDTTCVDETSYLEFYLGE